MNRYEELMEKHYTLKQAAHNLLLRDKKDMADVWLAKADTLKAMARELQIGK